MMTTQTCATFHGQRCAAGVRLVLLSLMTVLTVALWPQTADAQSSRHRDRHVDRSLVTKDAIRHQQMKRAYVAGAVAQHRRERVRDYYEDRYHQNRYQERRDNDLSRVLVGVAVGAVATSIIMNNSQ